MNIKTKFVSNKEFCEAYDLCPRISCCFGMSELEITKGKKKAALIVMNLDKCAEYDCFEQAFLHELAHVFHYYADIDDTEEEADDLAFEWCEELGIDTSIFKWWDAFNEE